MAFHVIPNDEHPLVTYINNSKLKFYASEAAGLLKKFPDLKVWEVQYKGQGIPDTAWYVGFVSKKEPFIMNFKIIPSNLNIEFRFSQFLPGNIFESLNWQNSSWRYADFKKFGFGPVQSMIKSYLLNIQTDFNDGKLKQGGSSFAEKMIRKSLISIFPDAEILGPIRPDDLRSSLNAPLELDIYFPQKMLAIEIQGPQHFEEIYGPNKRLKQNDQTKKEWCKKNGIKLIWMNWKGITEDLFKLPLEIRNDHLRQLVDHFLVSENHFMWWRDISIQNFE